VVTLAVFRLGGGERAIDTEDAAIEAHEIAPGRFSWRKYPGQINLELIRVFLSDAKKQDLVVGSGRTGWRLTQKGLQWAETISLVESDLSRLRTQSRAGGPEQQRRSRERSRIIASDAWKLWMSGRQTIPMPEIKKLFRLDSYAHGDLRQSKIIRLRAMFSNDDELIPFLDDLIQKLNSEEA